MRLTQFEKNTLWILLWVAAIVVVAIIGLPNFLKFIIIFISSIILLTTSIFICDELRDMFPLKYRIKIEKSRTWSLIYYKPQKLCIWWLFIPYWKAVDTEYTSYEYKNFFGGPSYGGYSTDVDYRSKKEALESIEKDKIKMERERKEFFKRPDKEEKEYLYIK